MVLLAKLLVMAILDHLTKILWELHLPAIGIHYYIASDWQKCVTSMTSKSYFPALKYSTIYKSFELPDYIEVLTHVAGSIQSLFAMPR